MPKRKKQPNELALFMGGIFLFLFFSFIIMAGFRLVVTSFLTLENSSYYSKHLLQTKPLPRDPLITPGPSYYQNK